MKKILKLFIVAIVLIGLTVFILPIILDPNQYKEEIASNFKQSTGYDLEIDGDLELSIFPDAEISASGLSISTGSKAFLTAEKLSANVSLMSLLSGEYKIEYFEILKPKLSLEKTKTAGNWQVKTKTNPSKQASPETSSKVDVSLDDIRIIDGSLIYRNLSSGDSYELANINVKASMGSIKGPFAVTGDVVFSEEKINLEAEYKSLEDLKLKLAAFGSNLTYSGSIEKGKLGIESEDVNKLLAKIDQDISFSSPKLNLNTEIFYKDAQLKLENASFTMGSSEGEANVIADLNSYMTVIESDIYFKKLKLEDFIPETKASEAISGNSKVARNTNNGGSENKMSLAVSLNADELMFKKANFKKAMLYAELEGKELTIQPFYAELPGGGAAQIYGVLSENSKGIKLFDGKLEANAKNLREVLAGLEMTVDGIKNDKLKNFYIDSKFFAKLDSKLNLELAKIKAKLDDISFNGKFDILLAKMPEIKYRGGISGIDLNKYLLDKPKVSQARGSASLSDESQKLDLSFLNNFPIKLDLFTAIGSFKQGEEFFNNVNIDAKIEPGIIDAKSFSLSSDKITASGKGKILAKTSRPRIDAELSISEINLNKFKSGSGKSSSSSSQNKKGEAKWSEEPFDFGVFTEFDSDFKINIKKLVKDKIELGDTYFYGSLKDSSLKIDNLSSKSFGGQIVLNGLFSLGRIASISANYTVEGLDLAKFLKPIANIDSVRGVVSFNGNAQASGATQKNLISTLKGIVEIVGTNIYVQGFDLDRFASQIVNLSNPANLVALVKNVSDRNGITHIRSLKGSIYSEKGILQTNGIVMDAGAAQGLYKGYADLNSWQMDTNAEFKVATPDEKVRPPLYIRIFGAIDDPSKDIDTSEIRKYITDRTVDRFIGKGIISEKHEGIVRGVLGVEKPQNQNNQDGQTPPKSKEELMFDAFRGVLGN